MRLTKKQPPIMETIKKNDSMPDVAVLTSLKTELNADAVEWCPISGLNELLVCANYELVENGDETLGLLQSDSTNQKRKGYLNLFGLQPDFSLKELSKIETSGILDIKWSRHRISGNACLAAVDSVGKLSLFKLDEVAMELVELSSIDLSMGDDSRLMLSLDWSNVLSPSSQHCWIVVSDSGGQVHIVSLSESKMTVESSRKAHEFECWIAAFDYFNTNAFYSGGDDSKLKVYDLRVCSNNAIRTSREHTAGVTSIQCNCFQEFSLVSGSYDERVLFWDSRNMKQPLTEISAPGGVWRIKHDPFDRHLIACPCMYGGSIVIDASDSTPHIAATYNFHSNINYGIDWCWKNFGLKLNESENVALLSVCSFYDKLLSVARYSS